MDAIESVAIGDIVCEVKDRLVIGCVLDKDTAQNVVVCRVAEESKLLASEAVNVDTMGSIGIERAVLDHPVASNVFQGQAIVSCAAYIDIFNVTCHHAATADTVLSTCRVDVDTSNDVFVSQCYDVCSARVRNDRVGS